jgi:hypothetical protein
MKEHSQSLLRRFRGICLNVATKWNENNVANAYLIVAKFTQLPSSASFKKTSYCDVLQRCMLFGFSALQAFEQGKYGHRSLWWILGNNSQCFTHTTADLVMHFLKNNCSSVLVV